jgi:hypothetical protein
LDHPLKYEEIKDAAINNIMHPTKISSHRHTAGLLNSGESSRANNAKAERYEWMREFYHVRGDYAHGKLESEKQMAWQELEHQALAKIIFPYVVKAQLSLGGYYDMSDEDKTVINMFEALAARQFLSPPDNQQNSYDTWWRRLYGEFSFDVRKNEILAALKE